MNVTTDKHKQATPDEARLTAIRRIKEAMGELSTILLAIDDIGLFGETAPEMEKHIRTMHTACRNAIFEGTQRRLALGENYPSI